MSAEELGLLPDSHSDPIEAAEQQAALPRPAQGAPDLPAGLPLQRTSPSTPALWNRQRLVEKVRAFWITGVLEQSLAGAVHLALELHECPDAVTNAWSRAVQQPDQSGRSFPPGTPITQIYDEAGGELLILGEPGAGKTTLLLELTRDLLQRAAANEVHPIPVVFNLSSWNAKRAAFAAWLVEELDGKYQVPRQVGQTWVENDQILPLLDGLDEVSPAFLQACVDAITTYRREHGLVPLVICSRREEYLELTTPLLLQRAFGIQPLTHQQIDDYLTGTGEQVKTWQEAFRNDAALQQLVTTPLMLSILTAAYRGRLAEDLKGSGTTEQRREQVFATYIERMFKRRKLADHYCAQQSIRWLAYLAQQMKQHHQSVFYLERMQFDWLPTPRLQQICRGLFVGLWAGLLSAVIVGFMALAMAGTLFGAFVVTPCITTGIGLLAGIVGAIGEKRLSTPLKKVATGMMAGTIVGGGIIWIGNLFPSFSNIRAGVEAWLVIVLVFLRLSIREGEIQPVEVVAWSWKGMYQTFSSSLATSVLLLTASGVTGAFFAWTVPGLGVGIIIVLLFGLLSLVIVGFLSGFTGTMLNERFLVRPNQGIRRSASYAVRYGLGAGLLTWLVLTLAGTFIARFFPHLLVKPGFVFFGILGFTLTIGLAFGFCKGGEACLKHLLLRLMLWRAGNIPWNYSHFLDYATERILLRKAGGGYMFMHRLLLDYFASLSRR
jgi:DNA polymerase III delta prime subunit